MSDAGVESIDEQLRVAMQDALAPAIVAKFVQPLQAWIAIRNTLGHVMLMPAYGAAITPKAFMQYLLTRYPASEVEAMMARLDGAVPIQDLT